MELIIPLIGADATKGSYYLFQVVMHAPLSPAYSQEKKWKASRLALRGAFNWDGFFPQVEDPQDILAFLAYHVDLVTLDGENQDQPIESALRALAYATFIDVLGLLDSTESFFVRGMRYAFQDGKPYTLRRPALILLSVVGEKWFNTPDPIIEPDQIATLCVDWASAVDSVDHDSNVQAAIVNTLFGMMNSPHWRPHVVTEKWKLFEYYPFVLDRVSDAWKGCLDSPELLNAVSEAGNPDVRAPWLTILWLKYKELIPEVRELLEKVTEEIAKSREVEIDTYLSVVESELERFKDKLEGCDRWNTDSSDVADIRMEIRNLTQARTSLAAFQKKD